MRCRLPALFTGILLAATLSASAASGRIIKVLPHFLDTQGRDSVSPSLFDRDAYQVKLRQHPALRGGLRYDVQWRTRGVKTEVKLRVELRGTINGKTVRERTLEQTVSPTRGLSRWTGLALVGEDYKSFGEVTAWRVTLWQGETQLAEQKSFLW